MSTLARSAARAEAAKPGTNLAALRAFAYTIPTDLPEGDGTFAWDSTTLVLVEVEAGGETGTGYTYTTEAAVPLIAGPLWGAIRSCNPMDPPGAWRAMDVAVRNIGRDGIAANAISAVDTALWDLKARLLDQPLALLFGRYRQVVPIYGSGGFTTYTHTQLSHQLAGWVERDGCAWVKMKIGTHPDEDRDRVRVAKSAIGERALFVDANGAYGTKQALAFAQIFAHEADIRWFEEPVSSDDLDGLRFVRHRAPAGIEIAAGEYGYDMDYFRTMLSSGAVDVQQADVTRCGGYTGFLQVAALCEAYHIDLSGHCAPALHLPVACAAPRLRHLEWFTITFESSTCCSTAHQGRKTGSSGRIYRARATGLSSSSRTRSASVSREVVTSGKQIGEDQIGLGLMATLAGLSLAPLLARKQKQRPSAQSPSTVVAARCLNRAAGTLAFSVLFDSAIEHYRGSFHNKAMYTPLVVSSLALAVSAHGLNDKRDEIHRVRDAVYIAAALTGAIGTGFHIYNVSKGPGGIDWQNLFYGAPLGAPAAIALSGLLGAAAERIRDSDPQGPRLFGLPAGRLAAAIASLGLLGTAGEASLLHFRGAFHNPFMFLPVTLPPVSAALLAETALGSRHRSRWFTRWWLRLTTAMGFIGVCFHAYGVHRNMGGWRNWRQNVLNGPPLPAPPSFAGLALAGLAALRLFEERPNA